MALDLSKHPCFNDDIRHHTGRIHLPVAPQCNVQCNYCNRKFDCVNESRPGVTSAVLSPQQALKYLEAAVARMPNLKVVGIAGPGDPFASAKETLETLRLVRERYPEMLLCVASNGLAIEPHLDELARLQVSHVTLTVNAVDPSIGSRIYAWVRDGKTIYRGDAAACVLLQRQRRAIKGLKQRGIAVKINSILIPGVNDDHVGRIAEEMASVHVDVMNCVPLYPVTGTPFGEMEPVPPAAVERVRQELGRHLPQMNHCTRCRADAVGILGEKPDPEMIAILQGCARGALRPQDRRPYVAVASLEGVLVNQHLGEAERLWIYAQDQGELRFVEMRNTPEAGSGTTRWRTLAETLHDCSAVIVSGVGRSPRQVLEEEGLKVLEMAGLISEGLATYFNTGDIPPRMRKRMVACGSECSGSGAGCA